MSVPSSSTRLSIASRRGSNSHDELVNDMISSTLGTDEHSTVLIKYGLMAVGLLAVLKIISQSLLYYALLASPFLYGYLKTTCPFPETFDAKEELKLVLGGDHLPDAHPDKPKSKLEKLFQSAKASVTAEYSALVGDTQMEFTNVMGCVILVKVTSQQRSHYWVGLQHQWRFVYSTPPPPLSFPNMTTVAGTEQHTQRRSSASASSSSTASASLLSSLTSSMSKKQT
jgi:hypothetical protein